MVTDENTDCVDGDVRLIGGQSELEGTLEICLNGTWGSVCDDVWGYEETGVVCNRLGYTSTGLQCTVPFKHYIFATIITDSLGFST